MFYFVFVFIRSLSSIPRKQRKKSVQSSSEVDGSLQSITDKFLYRTVEKLNEQFVLPNNFVLIRRNRENSITNMGRPSSALYDKNETKSVDVLSVGSAFLIHYNCLPLSKEA